MGSCLGVCLVFLCQGLFCGFPVGGQFLHPWGREEAGVGCLEGGFISAGEEQHLLSFPDDEGRECDGRTGTHRFCSVQIMSFPSQENPFAAVRWG